MKNPKYIPGEVVTTEWGDGSLLAAKVERVVFDPQTGEASQYWLQGHEGTFREDQLKPLRKKPFEREEAV